MTTYLSISKKETQELKGIALILLLVHHLFYSPNGMFDDITFHQDSGLVNMIGRQCKICVALFVFLSGYGLTASSLESGKFSFGHFMRRRFLKLFPSFWMVWAIFVTFGVFVRGITFSSVYGSDFAIPLLADFFGLSNLFDMPTYNATWWFMSCIIILYLLFPILYFALKRGFWLFVLVVFLFVEFQIPYISLYTNYLTVFSVGMVMAYHSSNLSHRDTALVEFLSKRLGKIIVCALCITVLLSFGYLRYGMSYYTGTNRYYMKFDIPIVLAILLLYKICSLSSRISAILSILGQHSMNIFLFHTFIYWYWWPGFIYAGRNPFFIFVKLLVVCLTISVLMEWCRTSVLHFWGHRKSLIRQSS